MDLFCCCFLRQLIAEKRLCLCNFILKRIWDMFILFFNWFNEASFQQI